ncbi:hypothetical protein FOMPIDRAFT_1047921 [Fomitopsis schrenkii]|uniref:Fungal-type protein kinase domain-containing protein n=1 Tax=Fomitopsis schrenkii TaxID=2126942 RepID=S8FVH3_FOMSC|nr:hypothetical protein FOMPIDRAFT_1047921 [Fomitopsis schrenkii]
MAFKSFIVLAAVAYGVANPLRFAARDAPSNIAAGSFTNCTSYQTVEALAHAHRSRLRTAYHLRLEACCVKDAPACTHIYNLYDLNPWLDTACANDALTTTPKPDVRGIIEPEPGERESFVVVDDGSGFVVVGLSHGVAGQQRAQLRLASWSTRMVSPLDPPWHTVRVQPRRLVESDLLDLVRTMADGVTALKGYCNAGALHGHLSPETIMIFTERPARSGAPHTYGVILDIDGSKCTPFVPGGKADLSGYRRS